MSHTVSDELIFYVLFVNKLSRVVPVCKMTSTNLDVFVGNDTLIDPDIYQLWLNGHSGPLILLQNNFSLACSVMRSHTGNT